MLISWSCLTPGRVKGLWNSAFKLAIVLIQTFELHFNLTKHLMVVWKIMNLGWKPSGDWTVSIPTWLQARLLFQYGVGLGYYSNMASGLVTFWHRTRALSSGQTNYEQCLHLSERHIYISESPQQTRFYTLRLSASLKATLIVSVA